MMTITQVKMIPRSWNERQPYTRIYFMLDDESLVENLVNRRRRPSTEYRKLMPQVWDLLKLPKDRRPERMRWSQYAGCSCPCSPGFVARGFYLRGEDQRIADVFVHITGEQHPVDYEPEVIAAQIMGGGIITVPMGKE